MSNSNEEYDKKFEEMQKYLPFLNSLIRRLEITNSQGKTDKGVQLSKIKELRSLLCDSGRRMKIENLLRCEQVLKKLKDKTSKNTDNVPIDNDTVNVPKTDAEITKSSDCNIAPGSSQELDDSKSTEKLECKKEEIQVADSQNKSTEIATKDNIEIVDSLNKTAAITTEDNDVLIVESQNIEVIDVDSSDEDKKSSRPLETPREIIDHVDEKSVKCQDKNSISTVITKSDNTSIDKVESIKIENPIKNEAESSEKSVNKELELCRNKLKEVTEFVDKTVESPASVVKPFEKEIQIVTEAFLNNKCNLDCFTEILSKSIPNKDDLDKEVSRIENLKLKEDLNLIYDHIDEPIQENTTSKDTQKVSKLPETSKAKDKQTSKVNSSLDSNSVIEKSSTKRDNILRDNSPTNTKTYNKNRSYSPVRSRHGILESNKRATDRTRSRPRYARSRSKSPRSNSPHKHRPVDKYRRRSRSTSADSRSSRKSRFHDSKYNNIKPRSKSRDRRPNPHRSRIYDKRIIRAKSRSRSRESGDSRRNRLRDKKSRSKSQESENSHRSKERSRSSSGESQDSRRLKSHEKGGRRNKDHKKKNICTPNEKSIGENDKNVEVDGLTDKNTLEELRLTNLKKLRKQLIKQLELDQKINQLWEVVNDNMTTKKTAIENHENIAVLEKEIETTTSDTITQTTDNAKIRNTFVTETVSLELSTKSNDIANNDHSDETDLENQSMELVIDESDGLDTSQNEKSSKNETFSKSNKIMDEEKSDANENQDQNSSENQIIAREEENVSVEKEEPVLNDFIKQYLEDAKSLTTSEGSKLTKHNDSSSNSSNDCSRQVDKVIKPNNVETSNLCKISEKAQSAFEQDILEALKNEIADSSTILENMIPKATCLPTKTNDSNTKKNLDTSSDSQKKIRRISLEKYKEKVNTPNQRTLDCKNLETKYIDQIEMLSRVLTPKELERFDPIIDNTIEDSIMDQDNFGDEDQFDIKSTGTSGPESPDSVNDPIYTNLRSPDDESDQNSEEKNTKSKDSGISTIHGKLDSFQNNDKIPQSLYLQNLLGYTQSVCPKPIKYPASVVSNNPPNFLMESVVKNDQVNNMLENIISSNTLELINQPSIVQGRQPFVMNTKTCLNKNIGSIGSSSPVMMTELKSSNKPFNVDFPVSVNYKGKNPKPMIQLFDKLKTGEATPTQLIRSEKEVTEPSSKKNPLLPLPKVELSNNVMSPNLGILPHCSPPIVSAPLQDPRLKKRETNSFNVITPHSSITSFPQISPNSSTNIHISSNDPRIKNLKEKPNIADKKSDTIILSEAQQKKIRKLEKRRRQMMKKKQLKSSNNKKINEKVNSVEIVNSDSSMNEDSDEEVLMVNKDVVILDETETYVVYDELIYETTIKKNNKHSKKTDDDEKLNNKHIKVEEKQTSMKQCKDEQKSDLEIKNELFAVKIETDVFVDIENNGLCAETLKDVEKTADTLNLNTTENTTNEKKNYKDKALVDEIECVNNQNVSQIIEKMDVTKNEDEKQCNNNVDIETDKQKDTDKNNSEIRDNKSETNVDEQNESDPTNEVQQDDVKHENAETHVKSLKTDEKTSEENDQKPVLEKSSDSSSSVSSKNNDTPRNDSQNILKDISSLLTVLNDKQKMMEMLSVLAQKDVPQKVLKKLELLAEIDSDDEGSTESKNSKKSEREESNLKTDKNTTDFTSIETSSDTLGKNNKEVIDNSQSVPKKKKKAKAKPRLSEIEVLRDSLPDQFVNDGGFNPGAIRMCRIVKEFCENEELPKRSSRQSVKKDTSTNKKIGSPTYKGENDSKSDDGVVNESEQVQRKRDKSVDSQSSSRRASKETKSSIEENATLKEAQNQTIEKSDVMSDSLEIKKINSDHLPLVILEKNDSLLTEISNYEDVKTVSAETSSMPKKKQILHKPCPKSKKKYFINDESDSREEGNLELESSKVKTPEKETTAGSENNDVTSKKTLKKKKVFKWQSGIITKRQTKKSTPSSPGEKKSETETAQQNGGNVKRRRKRYVNADVKDPCDKSYHFSDKIKSYTCKYCNYTTDKGIVKHYKEKHPQLENLISRLSPEEAEKAIAEMPIKCRFSIEKNRNRYQCRFCQVKINNFYNLYVHISHNHTGDGGAYKNSPYVTVQTINDPENPANVLIPTLKGYMCSLCNYTQICRKNLDIHVALRHSDVECDVFEINLSNLDLLSSESFTEPPPPPACSLPSVHKPVIESLDAPVVKIERDEEDLVGESVMPEIEKNIACDISVTENMSVDTNILSNMKAEMDDFEDGHIEEGVFSVSVNASSFSNELDITDMNSFGELDIKEELTEKCSIFDESAIRTDIKKEPLSLNNFDNSVAEKSKDNNLRSPAVIISNKHIDSAQCTEANNECDSQTFTVGKIEAIVSQNKVTYSCRINNCLFFFYTLSVFENHIIEQHPSENWNGFCPHCNEKTHPGNYTEALKHMYMHHLNDIEMDNDGGSKHKINVRPISHLLNPSCNGNPQPIEPFSLRIENVTSLSNSSNTQFIILQGLSIRISDSALFKCVQCKYSVNTQKLFMDHLHEHSLALASEKQVSPKHLSCVYCGSAEANGRCLVSHVLSTHGGCQYVCSTCDFRAHSYLIAFLHSVKQHKNVKNENRVQYVAIHNEYVFNEKNNGILPMATCRPIYKCTFNYCGMEFQTPDSFMQHTKVAKHDRGMQCHYCRTEKLAPFMVLYHLQKKHHYNLFRCPYCIFGTDSQEIILEHLLDNHANRRAMYYHCNNVIQSKVKVNTDDITEVNLDKNLLKHMETVTKLYSDSNVDSNMEIGILPIENGDIFNQPKRSKLDSSDDKIINLDVDDEGMNEKRLSSRKGSSDVDVINIDGNPEKGRKSSVKDGLSGKDLYRCGSKTCSVSYETYDEFSKHIQKCGDATKLTCYHCQLQCKYIISLLRHLSVHEKLRYKCEQCDFRTKNRVKCINHVKDVHGASFVDCSPVDPNKTNPYTDEFVIGSLIKNDKNKLEETKKSSDNHPKIKTNEPTKPLTKFGPENISDLPLLPILSENIHCSVCLFSTKVTSNMKRHLQLHATETPVPSAAPVNPVPHLQTNEMHFDKMTNLALSSNIHRIQERNSLLPKAQIPQYVDPKERYICGSDVCRYTSVSENMLERHWSTLHEKETSYFCDHCKKSVNIIKYTDISDHLQLHGKTLYGCKDCNLMHSSLEQINIHNLNKHSGKAKILSLRPNNDGRYDKLWRCRFCPTAVDTKAKIITHCIEMHFGDHKCNACTFTARTEQAVLNHFKVTHPMNTNNAKCVSLYYLKQTDKIVTVEYENKKRPLSDTNIEREAKPGGSVAKKPRSATPKSAVQNKKTKATNEKSSKPSTKLIDDEMFGEPQGNKFCCHDCNFTTVSEEEFRDHLYEELNYKLWSCNVCSYKTCTQERIKMHCSTEHHAATFKKLRSDVSTEARVKRCISKQRADMLKKAKTDDITVTNLTTNVSISSNNDQTVVLDDDSSDEGNKLVINEMDNSKTSPRTNEFVAKKKINPKIKKKQSPVKKTGDKEMQTIRNDFKCPYCPYLSLKLPELESHLKRHWKEKPLKCGYCDAQFIEMKQIKIHHTARHNNMPLNFIKNCNGQRNVIGRQRNMTTSRCGLCDKFFKHLVQLEYHWSSEHPESDIDAVLGKGNQVYKCAACNNVYLDYVDMSKHFTDVHIDQKNLKYHIYFANLGEQNKATFEMSALSVYQCVYCNTKIGNYGSLCNHQMNMHKEKEMIGIIPPTVSQIADLEEIKKYSHLTNPLMCVISHCNHVADDRKSLISHIRDHYYVTKCDICDKFFRFYIDYAEHFKHEHSDIYNDLASLPRPHIYKQFEVLDRISQIDDLINVDPSAMTSHSKEIHAENPKKRLSDEGASANKKVKIGGKTNAKSNEDDETFELRIESDDDIVILDV